MGSNSIFGLVSLSASCHLGTISSTATTLWQLQTTVLVQLGISWQLLCQHVWWKFSAGSTLRSAILGMLSNYHNITNDFVWSVLQVLHNNSWKLYHPSYPTSSFSDSHCVSDDGMLHSTSSTFHKSWWNQVFFCMASKCNGYIRTSKWSTSGCRSIRTLSSSLMSKIFTCGSKAIAEPHNWKTDHSFFWDWPSQCSQLYSE